MLVKEVNKVLQSLVGKEWNYDTFSTINQCFQMVWDKEHPDSNVHFSFTHEKESSKDFMIYATFSNNWQTRGFLCSVVMSKKVVAKKYYGTDYAVKEVIIYADEERDLEPAINKTIEITKQHIVEENIKRLKALSERNMVDTYNKLRDKFSPEETKLIIKTIKESYVWDSDYALLENNYL